MRFGTIAAILAAAVLLAGCAAAPGMTMQEPAALPAGPVVRVQPITVALLNDLAAADAAQARRAVAAFASQHEPYRIGPGDVLQVTVWDHPELTIPAGSFRDAAMSGQQVDDSGRMYYPYVGVVEAAGKTVGELRAVLTEALARYIQNPQLDVRVVAFRSQRVYVVGEVRNPGVIALDDTPLMIADAIARAGGLTPDAYTTGVNVSRDGDVHRIDLRALFEFADQSQNLMLQAGDIVNVPDRSRQKVFVMGEVRNPGPVDIFNGRLNLAAALGESGGMNQGTSDPGGIYVVRGSDTQTPEIFHLDASFATGLLLAERFELRAQDVVFVDTAGVSKWNRVISQLLPSISVLGIVDNVAR